MNIHSSSPTWENIIQIPCQGSIEDSIEGHHEDGHEEREGVFLQRTGLNVVPLQTQTLLLIPWKVLCPKAKGHLGQQALQMQEDILDWVFDCRTVLLQLSFKWSLVWGTYSSQLHVLGNAVLPGKAEDVWKIEGEVNDAAAGGRQIGLIEEDAH